MKAEEKNHGWQGSRLDDFRVSSKKVHTDILRSSCYLLCFDVFKKIRYGFKPADKLRIIKRKPIAKTRQKILLNCQ